jgi:tRNA A-37 threonylcarbamoyl transferase component Bud32
MIDERAPPAPRRFLDDADRAERAGDPLGAAAALRRHLEHAPDDPSLRLRLARLLSIAGEWPAARLAAGALNGGPFAREAERILAAIDEGEGDIRSAADHWERVLADDIDDAQARAKLTELRPGVRRAPLQAPTTASATLVSPEGVEALRYHLVREVGRGATATVYLARDEALGIDVALKVLHPHLASASRAGQVRRFFGEARLLAGLRHPGIVAVYDVDEPARALAMEWLPGGTLRARLRESPGGLPLDELAPIARSLLSALTFLHDRGLAHGDVKPSNVLLRAFGDAVLVDFGGAGLIDGGSSSSIGGGTPLYLAPEQFRGAPPSAATDLFGAGAILFELATGAALRSNADLMRGAPPESLPTSATRLSHLPPPWRSLILALLSPHPTTRTTLIPF